MGYRLWFKRRPDINEQNTGHEAFQRPMGLTYTTYKGWTGFMTGSLSPIYPGTIVPGNSLKVNDPTVTGNVPQTVALDPLSHDRMTQMLQNM